MSQTIQDLGGQVKHAYREMLGPTPVLKAGDTAGARVFLERILTTIKRGGWSFGERGNLYQMKRKWQWRASGQDEYFNKWGNGCQVSERNQKKVQRKQERENRDKRAMIDLTNGIGSGWMKSSVFGTRPQI